MVLFSKYYVIFAYFFVRERTINVSLSLISFPLAPLFCYSFLPLNTVMQRTMGSTNSRDDVTPPCWEFIISVRCSMTSAPFFSRTPRFKRVLGLVSSRFRWRVETIQTPSCTAHRASSCGHGWRPAVSSIFRDGHSSRVSRIATSELYTSVLSCRICYRYLCGIKNPGFYI